MSEADARFGPYRLSPREGQLYRDGEPVKLTGKPYDILVCLVREAGNLVEKRSLLEELWPDAHVEDAVLSQNIYVLRKVLEDTKAPHRYVVTVPRKGFRFVAEVIRDAPAAPSGASPAATSIAVLPFECVGPEAEQARYLGLGMADALIARLSRLPQLDVRPTSAVLGRDNQPETLRGLQVGTTVEGSIQLAGSRLRATVQLVDLERRASIWGDTFDIEFDDIFTMQDTISQQIADALSLELTSLERARLARDYLANREAYDAYIKGRFFWNKRSGHVLRRAIDCFHRAVALDARYAPAYAGLADAYVLLPLYGDTPALEAFPLAKNAAETALELDPDLAEAHVSRAYVRFIYDRDWEAAFEGLRRGIELRPSYATAHHWSGFFEAARGKFDAARAAIAEALRLDPLSLPIRSDLGLVNYFARDYDRAVETLAETLELDPGFAYGRFALALALTESGEVAAAEAQAREAVELSERATAMLSVLAYVLGRKGDLEGVAEVCRELEQRAVDHHVPAGRMALALASSDRAGALAALERADRERSRFLPFVGVWPAFDPYREDPEFITLAAEATP